MRCGIIRKKFRNSLGVHVTSKFSPGENSAIIVDVTQFCTRHSLPMGSTGVRSSQSKCNTPST